LERLGLNFVELRDPLLADEVLQYLEKCPLKYLEVVGTELSKKKRKEYEDRLGPKVGKLIFKEENCYDSDIINAFGSMKLEEHR